MADLVPLAETGVWAAQIHQRPVGEPLTGGPPDLAADQGFANVQAQQLANRTGFLKGKVDAIAFNMRLLTSSGNYVKPTGLRYARFIAIGAGAGGGGGTPNNGDSGGGGGGGGGAAIRLYAASDLAASIPYVIGAAGQKGFLNADGTAGGDTTILGLVGGGGKRGRASVGQSTQAGAAGGTPTGGQLNVPGGPGGVGLPSLTATVTNDTIGGSGGNAAWIGSGGAYGVAESSDGGTDASGYGGGGSGGPSYSGAGGRGGGNGAPGLIIVEEFF